MRRRRTSYRIPLAIGIGCYVLAAIAGMLLLTDALGTGLTILLWIAHGVLLADLLRWLRVSWESSLSAALLIVLASAMSVYVAGVARDDLTLQQRGEEITATVVKQWSDPPQGRNARNSYYTLERQDGTTVPGPAMRTEFHHYDVGQVLTVIADPEGELRPQTPGQASATGDALGAGALALVALGSVGWMTWQGSDAAQRRAERKSKAPSGTQRMFKTVTRDHSRREEQEEKLREALRTLRPDRRGYIKVHPEAYPDVSHRRAARIAWETGLRAEAFGNQGSWRFAESVVEEVPQD
ncbi:hypothetical protein BIV24_00295 [Streptomyces colonosanans]|uniref:DUF3592 domain-containing protein n=2 Tax=Streptomyces colonosanans TaxID=1428652 RepID=A0A1S2Q5X4_9ACTN|nr:hypothetical protein BIV24_00295 [Streptomyces colonosanans]